MLADTHCHLDFEALNSRLASLRLSLSERDVGMLVVPSARSETWLKVIELCSTDSRFYFGLGLHPYFIEYHQNECVSKLALEIARMKEEGCKKLVAIGEIGLDFTRPDSGKQIKLFEAQLEIAEKYALPVIIHVRKAHAEALFSLKKYNLVGGGVVHAFSGSLELMMNYIKLGLKIGVGPVITWPTSFKTKASISKAPLSALVLETDSPDMYVSGAEFGQGSPLDVCEVFEELKKIRPESGDILESSLWQNSVQLFIQ